MGKPKGKTPSLLTMSTGTPAMHTCGRATSCDRCESKIPAGAACFQIPKTKAGFTIRPIFCVGCTSDIIDKTNADLLAVKAALDLTL